MFEQYTHLLIPEWPDFAPSAASVSDAFASLGRVSAIPREASFRLGKLSGRVRKGRDPLTGETIELPGRDYHPLTSASVLLECLAGLDDYSLCLEGTGPPDLPPFPLYSAANGGRFTGAYGYSICFNLRREPFRLDDIGQSGTQGSPERRTASFQHPETAALIQVANAASARFWIALEFGRWVLPKIADSLEILDPSLLRILSQSLGARFAQGCSTY